MGLGIFQFVIGVKLIDDIQKNNSVGHKALKAYWFLVLTWFILFLTFLFTKILKGYDIATLYVILMLIGFYFTVVTYLIYKNQKS
ncbi:hypothetical protein WPG_0590 [Winogradskyella sp. PG-2]|nr:hypothetical protein WPG_0590 [Winogradskyella sp. PG-2]